MIIDSWRAGKINVIDELLFASSSGSENTGTARLDLLSNGFKVQDNSGGFNESVRQLFMQKHGQKHQQSTCMVGAVPANINN